MGKGGEQVVGAGKKSQQLKLDSMPTEELRKWAKAYGVDAEKERKALLEELVCLISNLLLFKEHGFTIFLCK